MNYVQRLIDHYARVPAGTQFARPADVLHLANSNDLPATARILDVGCGQGQVALAFAAGYPRSQITGVDLSPDQIAKARQSAQAAGVRNVQFEAGDWRDFKPPAATFDLVIATQVIQFFEDECSFIEDMAYVLRSGGQLLLRTVFVPDEEPGRNFVDRVMRQFIQHSVRFYSERDLTELLRETGFWHFRIDKEQMWLEDLPQERASLLHRELAAAQLMLDDVQPWFWSGTISAVKREATMSDE